MTFELGNHNFTRRAKTQSDLNPTDTQTNEWLGLKGVSKSDASFSEKTTLLSKYPSYLSSIQKAFPKGVLARLAPRVSEMRVRQRVGFWGAGNNLCGYNSLYSCLRSR